MERFARYHRADLGWLISAVLHVLLLAALATVTLVERRAHSGVTIDTRLSSEEAPSQLFTLVGDDLTLSQATKEVPPEAQSVAAFDSAMGPIPFDFNALSAPASLNPPADDPAELSLPVHQVNREEGPSPAAQDPYVRRQPNAGANIQSAGFFGLEAEGRRFVYIVDASRSMRGDRFRRACEELARSVWELSSDQGFYVFFFNTWTYPLFYPAAAPSLVPATTENKQRLIQWIGHAEADGSTYPKTALFTALAMQPDVIFILSDGKFPERTVRRVTARNNSGVVIHAIGFGEGAAEDVLKALAEQNGGHYKFVP